MPPLQPETSNYLWGGFCTKEHFSILPCAWQAQPSLNDTLPACPLAGVGGEGAWPSLSCGFFFHCIRPQGLAQLPAAGLVQRGSLTQPAPFPDIMCSPFRGSRGFQLEGELGMEDLPQAGEGIRLPRPPIDHSVRGLQADPGVAAGSQEPSPARPCPGTWASWPHPQPGPSR